MGGIWLRLKALMRFAPKAERRKSLRVLLAEDETAIRWLLAAALRQAGYEVVEAKSGPEALSLAAKMRTPPDLLLTDVHMPKMDGEELARRLADLQPGVRVLYISGYVGREQIDPASAFLAKPFEKEDFLRAVDETLGGTVH